MTVRMYDPDEDVSWMDAGLCRGVYGLMYPQRGEPTTPTKTMCAECPVQTECLDYAMRHCERFGIWGGTSERERRRIRRVNGPRPKALNPLLCGTDSGYHQHYRFKETPCARCKEAHSLYQQHRKVAS